MFEQRSKDSIVSSFSRYRGQVGLLDAEVDARVFSQSDCQTNRTSLSKDHIHGICFNSLQSYGNQKRENLVSIQLFHPSHERILPDFVSAGSSLNPYDPSFLLGKAVQAETIAGKCGNVVITPHRPSDPVAKFLDSQC